MANYTDLFGGGDANPIGGNWTTAPGRQAMQVYQAAARPTYNGFSDTSAAYVNSFTPAGSNQYSQASISYSGIGQATGGPAVRMSTSASSFYGLLIDTGASVVTFYKYVAGTLTGIGTIAYTFVSGDYHGLSANGSTLTWFLNGVPQSGAVTDTDLTTGRVGLWGAGDQIKFNDFDGGDLSGSPYTLTADASTYTLTGVDATLVAAQHQRTLTADVASFAVTDPIKTRFSLLRTTDVYWDDISSETGYRVKWGTQTGGPYTNSVDTAANVTTAALTGLIDGATPRTTYYWVVMGLAGTVEGLASAEQVFTVGLPPLIPAAATFTETGVAAAMSHGYTIAAVKSTFILTGVTATLAFSSGSPYTLTATLQPYFLTGVAATLSVGKNVITATNGTFTLSGTNTGLVYSGANNLTHGPSAKTRVGGFLVNARRNSTIVREKKNDRDTIEIKVSTTPQVTRVIKFNYDAE